MPTERARAILLVRPGVLTEMYLKKSKMAKPKKSLVEVKLALAEKYESLAKQSGSKPKQKRWFLRAERYRGQAAVLKATGG